MFSYQVTDKVGPTKNDSPDLNKPIDEQKSSISHFLKPAIAHKIKQEVFACTFFIFIDIYFMLI
jgi:hypothetical protein